jgi:hypothetical protein
MPITLIQVPLELLSVIDPPKPTAHRYVIEHLVRYCRHSDPLPAVTVTVTSDGMLVTRGQQYVEVARLLDRPHLMAIVSSDSSPDAVEAAMAKPGVALLDWKAMQAADDANPIPLGWHVFYFAHPLAPLDKARFNRVVAQLFSPQEIHVLHDDSGPAAEFEARTPVTDHAWARCSLDAYLRFTHESVRIVSYQGARFFSAAI